MSDPVDGVSKRKQGAGFRLRRGNFGIIQMLIVAIIGISIAFIIAAAILPTAINNMVSVNTTTWDNSTESLFDQIPLFGVIAIVVSVLGIPLAVIMLR